MYNVDLASMCGLEQISTASSAAVLLNLYNGQQCRRLPLLALMIWLEYWLSILSAA